MRHTVHYPVLPAGLSSYTFGRGTAVDRLLKVLSTARYRAPQATEGKGTEGHQVLKVSVRTVHRLRYGGTHSQRDPRCVVYPDPMYLFWCQQTKGYHIRVTYHLWGRNTKGYIVCTVTLKVLRGGAAVGAIPSVRSARLHKH